MAAGLLVLVSAPARSEIDLKSVQWQRSRWEKGKPQKPQNAAVLEAVPGAPLKGRVLAKLRLLNRGPEQDGILLRYVVSARIAPLDKPDQAAWALPFMLEEKRVPKVGANQYQDVSLDPTVLTALYLRHLYREGYWPDQLKLQVMASPRRGQKGPLEMLDSILPLRR